MARVMENVSEAVSNTVDTVQGKIRARRRRRMLAERWPMLVLLSIVVAGVVTGIAFAISQRNRMDEIDMNSDLDDLLGGGSSSQTVV